MAGLVLPRSQGPIDLRPHPKGFARGVGGSGVATPISGFGGSLSCVCPSCVSCHNRANTWSGMVPRSPFKAPRALTPFAGAVAAALAAAAVSWRRSARGPVWPHGAAPALRICHTMPPRIFPRSPSSVCRAGQRNPDRPALASVGTSAQPVDDLPAILLRPAHCVARGPPAHAVALRTCHI